MKVREITKTGRQRNIQYGGVSLFKHLDRFLQPEVVDILHAGHAGMLLKEAHKVVLAEKA